MSTGCVLQRQFGGPERGKNRAGAHSRVYGSDALDLDRAGAHSRVYGSDALDLDSHTIAKATAHGFQCENSGNLNSAHLENLARRGHARFVKSMSTRRSLRFAQVAAQAGAAGQVLRGQVE